MTIQALKQNKIKSAEGFVNPVLKEIIGTGTCTKPNGELCEIAGHITPGVGQFLQKLIREMQPVKTLEVGLGFGVSAMYICDALPKTPQTCHIVIDPYQDTDQKGSWEGVGLHNLKKAGYAEIIKFYQFPSYQVLPKLLEEGHKIDFAFIDGWHTFDFTLVDFFYVDKMLRIGGVIAFDDADWPAIHKLCRYIATNLSYQVVGTENRANSRLTFKRRILRVICKAFPSLRHLFNPEIMQSDAELGLFGRCVVFRKLSDDARRWDSHNDF